MVMNQTILVLLMHVIIVIKGANIDGYYWREFAGVVPNDALPGGTDHDGNPIYIGQILHDNKLLTAKIYQNNTKGYYGLNKKESIGTKNMKILCTTEPQKFAWIKTNIDEMHLLTNHHIVLGGYEPGLTLYIGRAFYNKETSIGRVSTGKAINYGLCITRSGVEINFKTFEILTYNANENGSGLCL